MPDEVGFNSSLVPCMHTDTPHKINDQHAIAIITLVKINYNCRLYCIDIILSRHDFFFSPSCSDCTVSSPAAPQLSYADSTV